MNVCAAMLLANGCRPRRIHTVSELYGLKLLLEPDIVGQLDAEPLVGKPCPVVLNLNYYVTICWLENSTTERKKQVKRC